MSPSNVPAPVCLVSTRDGITTIEDVGIIVDHRVQDDGDRPFSAEDIQEAIEQNAKARRLAGLGQSAVDLLPNLEAALSLAADQISQMRGSFDDEDGTIQNAAAKVDAALDAIAKVINAANPETQSAPARAPNPRSAPRC